MDVAKEMSNQNAEITTGFFCLCKTKHKKAVELKNKLFNFQEDFRETIKEPRIARFKNRTISNP